MSDYTNSRLRIALKAVDCKYDPDAIRGLTTSQIAELTDWAESFDLHKWKDGDYRRPSFVVDGLGPEDWAFHIDLHN